MQKNRISREFKETVQFQAIILMKFQWVLPALPGINGQQQAHL